MEANFSERVKEILKFSKDEAKRLNHDTVGAEHFFLSIIRESDDMVVQTLNELNVEIEVLKEKLEIKIRPLVKELKYYFDGHTIKRCFGH